MSVFSALVPLLCFAAIAQQVPLLTGVRTIYVPIPTAGGGVTGDLSRGFLLQLRTELFRAGFNIVEEEEAADAVFIGDLDWRVSRTVGVRASLDLRGRGQRFWSWSRQEYIPVKSCVQELVSALVSATQQDVQPGTQNVSINGKWVAAQISGEGWSRWGRPAEVKNETTFLFQMDGNGLSGTVEIGKERRQIMQSKLAGDQVCFSTFRSGERIYRGTVSPDEIRFSVMLEGGGPVIHLTAKRSY